jgi:hypothetical protein
MMKNDPLWRRVNENYRPRADGGDSQLSGRNFVMNANIRPETWPAQNHNGGPINAEEINRNRGNFGSLDPGSTWDIAIGQMMLQPIPIALTNTCTTFEYSESIGRHKRFTVQTKNASHTAPSAERTNP